MPFPGPTGTSEDETLSGSSGDDAFDAIGGNDWLDGLVGNDSLAGGEGQDTLLGNDGDDSLTGGTGSDLLWGGNGDDRLFGGAGQDTIKADGGADHIEGGDDSDMLLASGDHATLFGGSGDDYLMLDGLGIEAHGGDNNDAFVIGISAFTTTVQLFGDGGDDSFYLTANSSGSVDGGAGNDRLTLFWYDIFNPLTPVVMTPTQAGFGALTVAISGIESFEITAISGNDSIVTGDGDDWVNVLDGANVLSLGGGNDTAYYIVGSVNDLDGGAGHDTLHLGARGVLKVDFHVTEAGVEDGHGSLIRGFERYVVTGSAMNDDVSLGNGDDLARLWRGSDLARGGAGDDQMNGGTQNDTLWGGSGNDSLLGARDSDVLYGEDGQDWILLEQGADVAFGGAGDDRLAVRGGGHLLWGDEGSDRFVFRTIDTNHEWIGDFTLGEDRLLIAAEALNGPPAKGMLDPGQLTQGSMVTTDPQFLQYKLLSHSYLFWDPDGTGTQDSTLIAVFLNGVTLRAEDILII